MKINRKITRITCIALIASGVTFYVSSCKKSSNSTSTTTTSAAFSETDAANLTTDAVLPSTGGMVTSVNNAAGIYGSAKLACGASKDSSIVKSSAPGATPSYDYNLSWTYSLDCAGIVPNRLTLSFTGTGNYDGPAISSNDKSTGGYVLTGLGAANTNYTLGINYARTGTTVSKVFGKNTFTSSIKIVSTNLLVDKTTREITSGTATITIVATSTSGAAYNFTGTITFLGNKKATIVLNSGASYAIQWS